MMKKRSTKLKTKNILTPLPESGSKGEITDSSKAPHYDTQKSRSKVNTEVEMPHTPNSNEDFETESQPNSL